MFFFTSIRHLKVSSNSSLSNPYPLKPLSFPFPQTVNPTHCESTLNQQINDILVFHFFLFFFFYSFKFRIIKITLRGAQF